MSKRIIAMLTVLCLMFACFPLMAGAAQASETVESQSVSIKLAIGSPTVTINNSTSIIPKPVIEKGTTLVPLSVIAKAFGAKLILENNKKITLTYNSTVVVLVTGSDKVSVNGTGSTLVTAPKIVSGVTMVPVRAITQAFGAKIALNGNQITITGTKAGGTSKAGIDSGAGFSKIGDSYFNWSMKYPTDLSLEEQSDNGGISIWTDRIGNPASVIVEVIENEEINTSEEVRDQLTSYFSDEEIVLEKKQFQAGGATFEKFVTNDPSGWFHEYRAAISGNRLYVIRLNVEATTRDELIQYQPLLDSFTLSFNNADKKLKDITKVIDGMIAFEDKDYGLKVKLPVDWTKYENSSAPGFSNGNDELFLNVASVTGGETAEQWRKQVRTKLERGFAADYLRGISEYSAVINNGTGQVLQYEYSWDKKDWMTEYNVYYVSGNHKYELNFKYYRVEGEDADNGKVLLEKILSNLTIDTKFVDDNFSEIGEEASLDDVFVKSTSKKYGYSIELPRSWRSWKGNSGSLEDNINLFLFDYGNLFVRIFRGTANGFADAIDDYGARVISKRTEMINGASVVRVEFERPDPSIPSNSTAYIFEKNGTLIELEVEVYKANDTAVFRALLDKVVQSFTFTS